jgi:hypothetical protein
MPEGLALCHADHEQILRGTSRITVRTVQDRCRELNGLVVALDYREASDPCELNREMLTFLHLAGAIELAKKFERGDRFAPKQKALTTIENSLNKLSRPRYCAGLKLDHPSQGSRLFQVFSDHSVPHGRFVPPNRNGCLSSC